MRRGAVIELRQRARPRGAAVGRLARHKPVMEIQVSDSSRSRGADRQQARKIFSSAARERPDVVACRVARARARGTASQSWSVFARPGLSGLAAPRHATQRLRRPRSTIRTGIDLRAKILYKTRGRCCGALSGRSRGAVRREGRDLRSLPHRSGAGAAAAAVASTKTA